MVISRPNIRYETGKWEKGEKKIKVERRKVNEGKEG